MLVSLVPMSDLPSSHAVTAAREMGGLSLADALLLCELLGEHRSRRRFGCSVAPCEMVERVTEVQRRGRCLCLLAG